MNDADVVSALYREDFASFAARAFKEIEPNTDYEFNWHIDVICDHLVECYKGNIKRLIINIPPRTLKSYLTARAFPAWVLGKNASEKFIVTSYGEQVAEQNSMAARAIVRSEWYQKLFPETKVGELDRNTHWTTTVGGQYYAASALSPITGLGARFVLIDDPLKPMEASSETIRKSTNENIRATLFNRFNDKRTGCVILIMQRLHEEDPTGDLLRDNGWVHLKLPAEATEAVEISLGSKKWKMEKGDLLFPSRLSREILDQTRLDMTDYHYCTPKESPVLMADLSTKKISEVVAGDKVMGFTTGSIGKRKQLSPSTVQSVSSRKSKVVKITLDSGKVVRCTPDHRWYNNRVNYKQKYRKMYYPAKIGSKLSRICEPFMPEIVNQQDMRMAGWLAGFFDADGSAVVMKNTKTCHITFSQGTGRNMPLCTKLEQALKHFGFSFVYDERIRADNKTTQHKVRQYRITGNALENNRKLLHLIQVSKWRERINSGSFCSRFVKSEERVISIEEDGEETVFGLTTETGNYIVWGIASSNCGQYLQAPAPIGGGELRDEWVQYYQSGGIKPKEMNVAITVDAAGGEGGKKKKLSDYTAMIVTGLAPDNNRYVLDIIRDRLNPTERIDVLFMLHRKWNGLCGKPPKVGYEKYGLMTDTHYLREKMKEQAYNFPLIELGGGMSKEDRIRRMIPDMQNGRWYLPSSLMYVDGEGRRFDLVSEMVKSEMASFPRARYDDMIDAMSRIYDAELQMNFPRARLGEVAKARRSAYSDGQQDSWENF